MGTNIRSTRCLFMVNIIRSYIDFLYVKGNCLFVHKLPTILPPTGTYYFTIMLRFGTSFWLLGIFHQEYLEYTYSFLIVPIYFNDYFKIVNKYYYIIMLIDRYTNN